MIGVLMAKKIKKARLAINIILILLFMGALVYVTVRFGPSIMEAVRNPQQLKKTLESYGVWGVLVFIGLQVLQVVVVAIPGEFVQLAGGYIYGPWLGTLYSLIGIVLASVIVFYISRLLGYTLVRTFVSKNDLKRFDFVINDSKSEVIMLLLFLIPGLPKDALTYIAGLTPVKPLRFFVIITLGRLPALFASSYIGYSTQKGNYLIVVILSVAAIALFIAGLILKDKIIAKLH